ncbi:MAG: hypothetical protein MZV65_41050 [Chromatiales bacterium]|nr:hypothetical protein [Chromatiales bacterium]
MTAGNVFVNGVSVGPSCATDDTASSAGKDYSAIAKAAAFNAVVRPDGRDGSRQCEHRSEYSRAGRPRLAAAVAGSNQWRQPSRAFRPRAI